GFPFGQRTPVARKVSLPGGYCTGRYEHHIVALLKPGGLPGYFHDYLFVDRPLRRGYGCRPEFDDDDGLFHEIWKTAANFAKFCQKGTDLSGLPSVIPVSIRNRQDDAG